jgi:hypothetical protein
MERYRTWNRNERRQQNGHALNRTTEEREKRVKIEIGKFWRNI